MKMRNSTTQADLEHGAGELDGGGRTGLTLQGIVIFVTIPGILLLIVTIGETWLVKGATPPNSRWLCNQHAFFS